MRPRKQYLPRGRLPRVGRFFVGAARVGAGIGDVSIDWINPERSMPFATGLSAASSTTRSSLR